MEELLCQIEILKKGQTFIARVHSDLGGQKEYRSKNFEEVLEQMVLDLQEEFEGPI